jgi:hypothetical protein
MSVTDSVRARAGELVHVRQASASASSLNAMMSSRAAVARYAAPAVIVLAGILLLWSRFMMLNQSLWGDEAYSVAQYIHGGPSVIWDSSRWAANDHVLFNFLSWATSTVLTSHVEPTYRVWSVFPALAGTALMTWWLWQRIDRWSAAIFAVLATVAPLYFDLSVQARGYGLTFLATAGLVVAGDYVVRTESRGAVALFACSGFIGIASLETFVAPFLGAAAVLMIRPSLRRRTLIAVACVGLACLAWYGPLLSRVVGANPTYATASTMPWYGIFTAPTRDVFGPGAHVLEPAISLLDAAIGSGILMIVAMVALWRRWERMSLLLLVAPPIATYVLFIVAVWYHTRYASYAMPALFALVAIGLSAILHQIGRNPRFALPTLALMVALLLVTLARFVHYAGTRSQAPYEAASSAGQIVDAAVPRDSTEPIVTNASLTAWRYYIRPRKLQTPGPSALLQMFCAYRGKFVYFEQQELSPAGPDTGCLTRRGAFRIALHQRRNPVGVWLVPALPPTAKSKP